MDKKILLLTLSSLLVGVLLGHTGKTLIRDSYPVTEDEHSAKPNAQPRFGDSASSPLNKVPNSSRASAKNTELDKTFKRLARMAPEELCQEWEKMVKLDEDHHNSPKSREQELLLSYILNRLGREAPRQTLARIEKKGIPDPTLFDDVMRVWMAKNPEAAMSYCRDHMGDDKRRNALLNKNYISALSRLSPDKAMDYLATLPKEEQIDLMTIPLLQIMEKTPENMTEALQKAALLIRDSGSLHMGIAIHWAQQDWNAASQWLQSQPEGRGNAVMPYTLIFLPPEEAEQKLTGMTGIVRETAIRQIMSNLWTQSSETALEWLRSRTSEEEAAKVIAHYYYPGRFINSEFSAYLDRMPAGVLKDSLLEKKAISLSADEPEFAFQGTKMEDIFSTISQIDSPEKRAQMITSALDTWISRDPEKVKKWLENYDMPAKEKKDYMQRCDAYSTQFDEHPDPFD